ncbi:MAG: oxidoreductase [Rhodospirillaceae bacterium]|nr:oxidoreductase [Rhodospirillaceae bacterium]MDG1885771.1 SDR family NAD(P)-dependent oxidoreductase [Alphaproteobacteria bacterium]
MRNLNGMVAWVTGAGTGIGAGAAIALAREGVHVILTGRRLEPLEVVAASIRESDGNVEVAQGDAMDRPGMKKIAADIVKAHGKLDLLFNNHGVNVTDRNWGGGNLDGWDEVIDVNVKGAYNCAHAALEVMRPKGEGTIITTSSKAGVGYSPRAGVAYGASKHAVMALNQLMNIEEGNNGIRACVLSPGEVDTPILDYRPIPVPKEERERLIQSDDMGEIVVFIMKMPARVTLNEVIISPTYTRKLQPGEG